MPCILYLVFCNNIYFCQMIAGSVGESNNHKSCLVTSQPLSDHCLLQSLLTAHHHHRHHRHQRHNRQQQKLIIFKEWRLLFLSSHPSQWQSIRNNSQLSGNSGKVLSSSNLQKVKLKEAFLFTTSTNFSQLDEMCADD